MSIISLLNQVKSDDIVLPAIQRDFVWSEKKIQTLLDSIMRGYPIGIALLWDTHEDIQYRRFEKDYRTGNRPTFHDNSKRKKLKVVLDGQQRIQSLFIALYGQFNGKYLYFDVLSGRETEDFKEEKYLFYFMNNEKVNELNKNTKEKLQNRNDQLGENAENEYYLKVQDLFSMSTSGKQKYRRELTKELNLSEEDVSRLEINLSKLDEMLTKDINILKTSVIDEDRPIESPDRKSESDILEIFVRVNQQGTQLNRSDLIFSLLKLNWRESAEALPEFVDNVNEGNSFELDADFVIRCLFAVSNLGTKFDIDMLRKKTNMDKMKHNFHQCCKAIRSVIDIVQQECWCASSKVIGGYYTLVPFVYYLFHIRNHQVPNNQIENFRKALYILGFTRPFSRYAESRLQKFIREELKPLAEKNDHTFPYKRTVWWVGHWEKITNYGEKMIQGNYILALHVVQQLTGAKTHYKSNSPEVDHIFPRSILRNKDFDEAEVNHFANFWILGKEKNQNKSNMSPDKYFKDVSDKELEKALINRDLLSYSEYKKFLEERGNKILSYVKKKVGFSDDDFEPSIDINTIISTLDEMNPDKRKNVIINLEKLGIKLPPS